MNFFSIQNILVYIPLGESGYALSWIEAIGTLCGLLCIWLAGRKKIINYFFGLINISLFAIIAIIFLQIQFYAGMLLPVFFFFTNIYACYACLQSAYTLGATNNKKQYKQRPRLKIRRLPKVTAILLGLFCIIFIILIGTFIDPITAFLTHLAVTILHTLRFSVSAPWLYTSVMVLPIVAMILMTKKYVENNCSRLWIQSARK